MKELSKDVVKGSGLTAHLEALERELEKKVVDDPLLRDHIRQLKFAWRKGQVQKALNAVATPIAEAQIFPDW